MTEENLDKNEINEEIKKVVIARIEAQTLSNLRLFIGSSEGLSKNEIIAHIRSGDEIGNAVVKSHLSFMRAIASGEFIKAINSVD